VDLCSTHPQEEGNLLLLLRVMVLQPGTIGGTEGEGEEDKKKMEEKRGGERRAFFVV